MMIKKVRDLIQSYGMLKPGDSVIAALSGGADSVALLLLLLELSSEYDLQLFACHVNHHLRGAESDADAAFCSELCGRLAVPLTIFDADVPAYCREHKVSVELGARELRYACLAKCAQQGETIATAHTLSDNLETVLFHLARGTSLDGLCGIAPVRGNIIRPLLTLTRDEVEEYLAARSQPFVTDSTNADDAYHRNHIRKNIIPQLRKINPALEQSAGRMLLLNRQDRDYLNQQASVLLQALRSRGGLDAIRLAAVDTALQGRVITLFLKEAGLPYDYRKVRLLQDMLLTEGAVSFATGQSVAVRQGILYLQHATLRHAEERQLEISAVTPLRLEILGKIFIITPLSGQEIKFSVNNRQKEFQNCLDCDKINKLVTLRTRREGDMFSPVLRGCTKSLKKLMNEAKISLQQREDTLLLCDGEPIWVEGFGVSRRAALSADTKRAVRIEIILEETDNA